MTRGAPLLPESQLGPAERLLDLVLGSSAHLWHNRPGLDCGGVWYARRHAGSRRGRPVSPGLFVPAATALYQRLVDIHRLNPKLMAHFASYALVETDWRDLKVACAALMLVQPQSGQPVRDDDGSVAFHDDDYRAIGEAMLLHYEKGSVRMLTPKGVLRVGELLETAEIARINRQAGFGDPAARKAPLGRWKRAATRWLAIREQNVPMLEGLVKAGYKETLKKLARKIGYKPHAPAFFEILGWKQAQAKGGHRTVGMTGLKLEKRARFDGLSELEICEAIDAQRLGFKDVMGRLPKDVGLTPAIMAVLLPSLSDRDLRILTPTLEDLGLMADVDVRRRWEAAIATSTDQRGLHVAKNVKNTELVAKLEESADNAARRAVKEATRERDVRVMFLIDKSGSMQGAIEKSTEALARLLAGFPADRLHVAMFDTMGTVLVPKAPTRAAVLHMLRGVQAAGGTMHGAGVRALHAAGLRVAAGTELVVLVVGDEAGETGADLARVFRTCAYPVRAMAMLVNVAVTRGRSVRDCARELQVPFSEIQVEQLDDPYQVPRVLAALLDTPVVAGASVSGWVERVMKTPLVTAPSGAIPKAIRK